jgi:hypothetical protein
MTLELKLKLSLIDAPVECGNGQLYSDSDKCRFCDLIVNAF